MANVICFKDLRRELEKLYVATSLEIKKENNIGHTLVQFVIIIP